MAIKHSKKRNTALLHEFLIRHISNCLINDNKVAANKALDISKRYFSKGSPLGEELNLFRTVLNSGVKSQESARKVLEIVQKKASEMNARKLDEQKSKLIKELNYTFTNEIYEHKIPNYTIFASLQVLFNENRNKVKSLDEIEKIKLEETVSQFVVSDKQNLIVDGLKVNPKYNNAVHKFAFKRFHEKYSKRLSESQKRILTKYTAYMISENKGELKSALQKEALNIKNKLNSISDQRLTQDKDLMKKIRECLNSFEKIDFDDLSEKNVLEVLQYITLAEEVESE